MLGISVSIPLEFLFGIHRTRAITENNSPGIVKSKGLSPPMVDLHSAAAPIFPDACAWPVMSYRIHSLEIYPDDWLVASRREQLISGSLRCCRPRWARDRQETSHNFIETTPLVEVRRSSQDQPEGSRVLTSAPITSLSVISRKIL